MSSATSRSTGLSITDSFSLLQGSAVGTTGTAFTIDDALLPTWTIAQKQTYLEQIFQCYRQYIQSGQAGPGWYWYAQFKLGKNPIFFMLVVREDGEATPQTQYPWTCVGPDHEKILATVQRMRKRNPVFYDALLEVLMRTHAWPVICG